MNYRNHFWYKGFRVTYQNFSPRGHRGLYSWITEDGCNDTYHGTSEGALTWIDAQVDNFGED